MHTEYRRQLSENLQVVIDCERERGTIHIAAFLLDFSAKLAREIAGPWIDLPEPEIASELPLLHSAVPRELGREALVTHIPSLVQEFDAICLSGEIPLVTIMGSHSACVLTFSRFQRRIGR